MAVLALPRGVAGECKDFASGIVKTRGVAKQCPDPTRGVSAASGVAKERINSTRSIVIAKGADMVGAFRLPVTSTGTWCRGKPASGQ